MPEWKAMCRLLYTRGRAGGFLLNRRVAAGHWPTCVFRRATAAEAFPQTDGRALPPVSFRRVARPGQRHGRARAPFRAPLYILRAHGRRRAAHTRKKHGRWPCSRAILSGWRVATCAEDWLLQWIAQVPLASNTGILTLYMQIKRSKIHSWSGRDNMA